MWTRGQIQINFQVSMIPGHKDRHVFRFLFGQGLVRYRVSSIEQEHGGAVITKHRPARGALKPSQDACLDPVPGVGWFRGVYQTQCEPNIVRRDFGIETRSRRGIRQPSAEHISAFPFSITRPSGPG